ncbi:peptide deformylase [Catenuloplanes indicus]|uniref:Peptide deformylase n=1 Tax=Catenuloplanes indicus TaxID=137267 RepID=A0AAE3W3E6_9ACTN|nr:peptide deformylase [Catenuloplanes indicus]MDQ0367630.1 peptide deformylase [Catenuloplanes indicus]
MTAQPASPTSPLERAADSFAAELSQWRADRGMTKKQLAARMGFDPSYVSHVEGRRHRPTEDFARRAEAVLDAGGRIWQRFQEYDELRHVRSSGLTHRDPPVPEQWLPPGTGLVVEQEIAELVYADGEYRCVIRRALYNAGTEPVTRYMVKVAVDRYPGDPERSNRHHREHPLSFDELKLTAFWGAPYAREPMRWRKKRDRDADKEMWLLFENDNGRFPLYPGQRTTIEYGYSVAEEKWGQWFQRAVRLPTRQLTVRLDFPAALDPTVWGEETSLSAEEAPLRTPFTRHEENDRAVFEWSTDEPPLNARYKLSWRFRGTPAPTGGQRASDRMRAAGILQRGDTRLGTPARRLPLPEQARQARDVAEALHRAAGRVETLHDFRKGMGLAAPQIGLPVAVAVIRPPDPAVEPVTLINPRVVTESAETDVQYEGCLSFFDERGPVRRPLRIDVEHERWDGTRVITTFERAMARLVAHEIDHLDGRLYLDRMPPDARLVSVEEYQDGGLPWRY